MSYHHTVLFEAQPNALSGLGHRFDGHAQSVWGRGQATIGVNVQILLKWELLVACAHNQMIILPPAWRPVLNILL